MTIRCVNCLETIFDDDGSIVSSPYGICEACFDRRWRDLVRDPRTILAEFQDEVEMITE